LKSIENSFMSSIKAGGKEVISISFEPCFYKREKIIEFVLTDERSKTVRTHHSSLKFNFLFGSINITVNMSVYDGFIPYIIKGRSLARKD
jgi:hypothetical protein